jgi:hypothetical protein
MDALRGVLSLLVPKATMLELLAAMER